MDRRSREISRAMEWVLPLGVCCAEAQADGVPCWELGAECLECDRADPVRQLMLRLASARVALPRELRTTNYELRTTVGVEAPAEHRNDSRAPAGEMTGSLRSPRAAPRRGRLS